MPFAEGLTVMTKSHPLLAEDHITLSSKQNRHDNMKLVALALAAPAVTGLQFGSKPAAPKGGFQLPAAPSLPSPPQRRMSNVPSKCDLGCDELGFQPRLSTPISLHESNVGRAQARCRSRPSEQLPWPAPSR